MLRQILRFQFIARQSSKSVVIRFFSNKSTKSATKSIRKNLKNGAIFCPTLHSSTFSLAPLGTYAFKNYSTSNKGDNTESFEDLMALLSTSIQQRDFDKALECATKALEISKTSQQFQDALQWKLPLQFYSDKPNWDDDFLATVQKLDPNSVDFSESWDRLLGTLVTLKSYDTRSKTLFDKAFKVFPNNFIVIMKKAEVLFHYGLVDEVEPLLMQAIKIDSNRCRPWVLLWKLYPTHEKYLKKALECPDSEKEIYLWCEYATKQILQDGDIEAGMESLKKAIAIYRPILPAVDNTLSYIATQLHTVKKDSKSAEKVVRLWLEECPNNGIAWSLLGAISSTQRHHQEAERCYRKAIALDPSLAVAWYNLGNMVAPKEGIPLLLQAIQLQPDLHPAHYKLAMNYRDLQQYEKALESVNRALQLKKHTLYLTLKASICGLVKQYKEEFLTGREILSANAQDTQCACVLFQMEERYEEGLAYIREQIKHDPKNHSFLITEATFLNNLKRYDEALKVVDQAIQIAREKDDRSEYNYAMHYKAIILARSGNIIEAKQLAEVIQQYEPALVTYPLGIVYLKEGNFDKAVEMFEFNANFKGFETLRYTYFMDIAAVYEAKGDLLAAEKYLNLVLEINPDAKSAAEKLKEIKKNFNGLSTNQVLSTTRGSREGGNNNRSEESRETKISKALSYLLRHGAQSEGINIRTDGYCPLQQILKHKSVAQHGAKLDDICRAVATNAKKRFALKMMQEDNTLLALDDEYIMSAEIHKVDVTKLYIAAVQGHSIVVPELDLKPITKLSDLPEKSVVVHGTKKEFWKPIYDTGLNKMTRTHIHFAIGLPGDTGVVSGMRNTSDLLIYPDVEAALRDGYKFYLSQNNVVLCDGLNGNGVLPSKYFKYVIDAKTMKRHDPKYPNELP